ncbi:MAG: hypothetical protein AAF499_02410 [Pseudomonadota bacterium]
MTPKLRSAVVTAAICSIGFLGAGPVSAASPFDWQGSVLRFSLDAQRYTVSETDFDVLTAVVGASVPIDTGVMVELNFGQGVEQDEIGNLELQVDRFSELSLRMTAPPTDNGFRVMSRLGFTFATLETVTTTTGASTDSDLSGYHFSLGVERALGSNLAWSFEAVHIDLDDDIRSAALRGSLSWSLRP